MIIIILQSIYNISYNAVIECQSYTEKVKHECLKFFLPIFMDNNQGLNIFKVIRVDKLSLLLFLGTDIEPKDIEPGDPRPAPQTRRG